jgi:hypothetical protein
MELLSLLLQTGLSTITDVLPIAAIIFGFQVVVLRQRVPNLKKVLIGFMYVLVGLTLFLVGLQEALFPLGRAMAQQLTDPGFIQAASDSAGALLQWQDYFWVYLFAAAIGFSTTIAEPSLIAVAIKANQVSTGAIGVWGLRIAVAIGVATGIALGVIIQTLFAPRIIIALAYDSGGVTTSTVTVPLVAALGLGLASTIPGRSPLLDGFGLIAFASLFPIISVMAYAQLGTWWVKRNTGRQQD